jgi:hypothetical protein
MGERGMGLVVSAHVVRDLIGDGEYIVECIEQREHGRVMVALTLRARAQPYSIQIETSDNKLDGFFRAWLNGQGSTPGKNPAVNVGSQPVPVVEVDAMPADQPKRRRRPAKAAIQPEPALREENPSRADGIVKLTARAIKQEGLSGTVRSFRGHFITPGGTGMPQNWPEYSR